MKKGKILDEKGQDMETRVVKPKQSNKGNWKEDLDKIMFEIVDETIKKYRFPDTRTVNVRKQERKLKQLKSMLESIK